MYVASIQCVIFTGFSESGEFCMTVPFITINILHSKVLKVSESRTFNALFLYKCASFCYSYV